MNIQDFFTHHGLTDNPFNAEEARLDPVFERMQDAPPAHPDFEKILGRVDQPSTAVVFGEKGSGKTALRLLMGKTIAACNSANPGRAVFTVGYDDLNPVLDRLLRRHRQDVQAMLKHLRLEDHQDAILARAVTRLNDALLGQAPAEGEAPVGLPEDLPKKLKKLPKATRRDWAWLTALFDEPRTGTAAERLSAVRKKLRLSRGCMIPALAYAGGTAALAALLLWLYQAVMKPEAAWITPAMGIAIAGAVMGLGYAGWSWSRLALRSLRASQAMPSVHRGPGELRKLLATFPSGQTALQPLPVPGAKGGQSLGDTRYQLTRKLTDLLGTMGYLGIIVFIDRMDEPTAVQGDAERMRAVTWPMFDNKFLKQERVGLKLLLPIELSYLLKKEGPDFYQEARLDKQNMIERLSWSGATLYDLCSTRLRACRKADAPGEAKDLHLTDLFEEDVTRDILIDALDQMHQPRDAFKFLYGIIQEHCRMVPGDSQIFRVPRLTLENVRRNQAQRVQDLQRGLGPA